MSDIIRTRFQVLNEFRHSKSKNIPMGTDYSSNYAFDKNIMLYIYDPKLKSMITFKSFLQDFSINFNISYDDDDTEEGASPINPKDFTCNYKLKLDVPSPSINDARINDAKFSELNRMMIGQTLLDNDTQRFIDQPKRILMANLIHNGTYKPGTSIRGRSSIIQYGMPCRFSKINWEPDIGLGFFESGGKIWPKSYSFDLELDISFKGDPRLPKTDSGFYRRSFSGFKPNGKYEATDIRTWPFGDLGNKSLPGYSGRYADSKSAYIYFKFEGSMVRFKPFLDGFSFDLERSVVTTDGEKIYSRTPRTGNFKKATYSLSFSVLAGNIIESKENHRKFHKLARMICPNDDDIEKNRIMKVQFANLISRLGNKSKNSYSHIEKNGVDLIAKSISYVPIMELGFFEHNTSIYAKGYKISLTLETPLTDEILEPPIRVSGFNYGSHPTSILLSTYSINDEENDYQQDQPENEELQEIASGGGGESTADSDPRSPGFYDDDGDGRYDTHVYISNGETVEESLSSDDPDAVLNRGDEKIPEKVNSTSVNEKD